MPWIKIDDKIRNHPKFLKAGPVAAWLWVCGQSYCADYLTDGFIPDHALGTLGAVKRPRKYAETLVKCSLWERESNGYRVRNYLEYQPSREVVESVRSHRKEAGKLGGLRSGAARHIEANGKQIASPVLQKNRTPVPSVRDLKNRSRTRRAYARRAEQAPPTIVEECPHTPPCTDGALKCRIRSELDRAIGKDAPR